MRKNLVYYANLFKTFYTASFKEEQSCFHLSQIEVDILLFLRNNPDYNTARDICSMRGLSKSNVSTGLADLEKRKYVKSAIDQGSKKIHRLFLTPESEEVVSVLAQKQKECMDILVKGFTEEEISQMANFFKRCNENIEMALEKGK